MGCSADTGPGKRGRTHRWDLHMVARIYMSHTGMCHYRCTACCCLSYMQLCPWSRRSCHLSSHHHTGTGHTCTAHGLHTLFWMRLFIKLDLLKNHINLCTSYLPFQSGQSKFAHSQYLPEYFSSGFSLWAHSQKPSTHLPLLLQTGSFGPVRHASSFCDDKSRLLWHHCPAYGSSHSHLPHTRAPWPLQSRLLSWRVFVHSHWPEETIFFWSPIV